MLYLSSESAHHYCKLAYFSSHSILGIMETRIDYVKWDFGQIAWSVFHFKLGKMNTFYLCIGLLTVKIVVKNVQTRRSWVDVSNDGRQCLVISRLCSSSLFIELNSRMGENGLIKLYTSRFPPTSYVGHIWHSTAVATASWSTFEGTL